MKYFLRVFTPTKNRRLNELIGFLMFVSAILLFLALASYSPQDPSLNTAGSLSSDSAHNWIGLFGSLVSDLLLQSVGIVIFVIPVMIGLLGARWFKSRTVASPGAKMIGAAILLIFTPALLGLLPGQLRWFHAVPIEGLLGRIVGDALLHYFNQVGAYIVSITLVAVALYLSTAFSFSAMRLWFETRFVFAFALWQRFQDWKAARAQKKGEKAQQKLDRRNGTDRRAATVIASAVPRTQPTSAQALPSSMDRLAEVDQEQNRAAMPLPQSTLANAAMNNAVTGESEPSILARADREAKRKTVMPKVAAGGYKLPPSSLLHRGEDQQAVNEAEVKAMAEVLTEKYAEFDVGGAVTQINPGPVVTTYEFKPDAGV